MKRVIWWDKNRGWNVGLTLKCAVTSLPKIKLRIPENMEVGISYEQDFPRIKSKLIVLLFSTLISEKKLKHLSIS